MTQTIDSIHSIITIDMSLRLLIGGQQFNIDEALKSKMSLFLRADILERLEPNTPIQIKTIAKDTFVDMLTIYKQIPHLPQVPKVRTNDMNDVLGPHLATILSQRNDAQLNDLYRAAQILQFNDFRKCIVAAIATKARIPLNYREINFRMRQLGLQQGPTNQDIKEMKDKYMFLN